MASSGTLSTIPRGLSWIPGSFPGTTYLSFNVLLFDLLSQLPLSYQLKKEWQILALLQGLDLARNGEKE